MAAKTINALHGRVVPAAPRWQLLTATERAPSQRSGSDEAACCEVSISAPSGHLSEAPTPRAWLSFIPMSRRPQPQDPFHSKVRAGGREGANRAFSVSDIRYPM